MKLAVQRQSFFIIAIVLCFAVISSCSSAKKDETVKFPNGNITLIIPYGAGGNADTTARLVSQYLSEELKVSIVCVNKPGSGGDIGAVEIANAKTDGQTIGMLQTPDFMLSDVLNPDFPFDFFKSVDYLVTLTKSQTSYWVSPGSELNTWDKFVAYCKSHPGEVTIGEGGIGSRLYSAAVMDRFKIKFTLVSFNSSNEAIAALIGKHIFGVCVGNAMYRNLFSNGCIPVVWGGHDLPSELPQNTPFLIKDYGMDDLDNLAVMGTFVTPKGVPEEVVKILTESLGAVANRPEMKEKMEANGHTYEPLIGEAAIKAVYDEYDYIKKLCTQYKDIIIGGNI
jgi:tripartite-type tricarboxylate transporter receptor subunit TctC